MNPGHLNPGCATSEIEGRVGLFAPKVKEKMIRYEEAFIFGRSHRAEPTTEGWQPMDYISRSIAPLVTIIDVALRGRLFMKLTCNVT